MKLTSLLQVPRCPLSRKYYSARYLSDISRGKNVLEGASGSRSHPQEVVESKNNSDDLLQSVKPLNYNQILAGIESRSASYFKVQAGTYAPRKNIIKKFGQVSYADFISPPEVGDLVLSKYAGPVVLLQNPKDSGNDINKHKSQSEKDFLACDPSGIVIGINKSEIVFSLGKLVYPTHLNTCIEHLDVDGTSVMCLSNLMKRSICPVLRSLVTDKYSEWDELLPIIERQISGVNETQKTLAVNIPFFQLAQEVDKCINAIRSSPESITIESQSISNLAGDFPPMKGTQNSPTVSAVLLYSLYEAVSMVFDRKIIINSKDSTLTLLPKTEVARFAAALSEAKRSPNELIKSLEEQLSNKIPSSPSPIINRYALGDINPHDVYAQSAALSLARKLSYFKSQEDKIQPFDLLELQGKLGLTNTDQGPFFESHLYDFLRNVELKENSIPPVSYGRLEYDRVDKIREDLGNDVPVYCIDASDSHEIDDGISITDISASRVLIGVHIADPTSSFKSLNDDILRRAYGQSSTVYFPSGPITMFPTEFTKQFSLESDLGCRRCLTISFIYDEVERKIVKGSTKIIPQFVNKVVNITYDQVNDLLSQGKSATGKPDKRVMDFKRLYEISASLLNERLDNGAINFNIKRAIVKVEPDTDEETAVDNSTDDVNGMSISLDKTTPAHMLVSELMIRTNSQVAAFTVENSIPNIYRTQAVVFPTGDNRPKLIKGAINEEKSFQLLQAMRPSVLSVRPGFHQSLGISQYCGVTSPLRRFQDIITHWQVYSHLLDNDESRISMLTEEQLNTVSLRLQSMQNIINSAQRKSLNYWVLRKLENLASHNSTITLRCVIASRLSSASSTQRVYLSDWGIYGKMEVKGVAIPVGTKTFCNISRVSATIGVLQLVHVDSSPDVLIPE